MKIKELQHWAEDVGMTVMPWNSKDWKSVLILLSKVLADDLSHRKPNDESNDITFKISFDDLLKIAEDVLGIPHIIIEDDLSPKFPNISLALFTYMLCMKQSLGSIDTRMIKDVEAPKLVFEANTDIQQAPNCISCGLYAFFVERVIIDKSVWHRRCFVCSTCQKQLYRGSYRSVENGKYECVEHFSTKILSKFGSKNGNYDSGSSVKPRLPPPRPPPPNLNRVSAIIQKQMQDHVNNDKIHGQEVIKEVVEIEQVRDEGATKLVENLKIEVKPIPKPRSNVSTLSRSPKPIEEEKKKDISEYPGFLNPFGTDDEDEDEEGTTSSDDDYNESLNPFADDEEEEHEPSKPPETVHQPQPSPQPSTASSTSDRPKSTPPPPPKPPRASLIPQEAPDQSMINRVVTLPRAKKAYRAPPPPIPVKRKIEFTENKSFETLEAIVGELKRVKTEHDRIEAIGKNIEKDLLFKISRESIEWKKEKKIEEWMEIVEQKCSIVRREAVLIHVWLEKFLNDIHADTEYQLRCVLEGCEGKDRSEEDITREAELLEVLVDIMSLKNGMIESGVDPTSLIDSQSPKSSAKSNSSKMKKIKIRMKKLKKKL